jgi:hypothetical protein
MAQAEVVVMAVKSATPAHSFSFIFMRTIIILLVCVKICFGGLRRGRCCGE